MFGTYNWGTYGFLCFITALFSIFLLPFIMCVIVTIPIINKEVTIGLLLYLTLISSSIYFGIYQCIMDQSNMGIDNWYVGVLKSFLITLGIDIGLIGSYFIIRCIYF